MHWLTKLIGTAQAYFRIGYAGPRLKNSSGALHVRDAGDTAFANIEAATLKANDADVILDADGNALTLSRNASQSGALQQIFPPAKGTDGQVLAQKAGTGAGVIEYEFVSSASTASSRKVDTTTVDFNSSSPVTMFTLPANAVVHSVWTIIDTAFDDAAATLTVGVNAGDAAKYTGTTDSDLDQAAETVFETVPGKAPNGSTEALEVTLSAGTSTQGSVRVEVDYSIPA